MLRLGICSSFSKVMIGGGILCDIRNTTACSRSSKPEYEKVNIYSVDGSFLVWEAETATFLREKFGVSGVLVGTLPRKPRQNRALGLPLQIMKEEAIILQREGVVNIVKQKDMPVVCSEEKYADYLAKSYKEQNEFLQNRIFSKSQKFVEEPVEVPVHLNLSGKIDIDNPPYHLQRVFNRQSREFWSQSFGDINEFELSESEKLRLVVLQDLRRRNYLITSGSKFGGDFLVYPGDPLVYHAYFIVKVVPKGFKMKANELLAFSRLATSVKKVAVLGTVDGSNISYLSLQWSGLK